MPKIEKQTEGLLREVSDLRKVAEKWLEGRRDEIALRKERLDELKEREDALEELSSVPKLSKGFPIEQEKESIQKQREIDSYRIEVLTVQSKVLKDVLKEVPKQRGTKRMQVLKKDKEVLEEALNEASQTMIQVAKKGKQTKAAIAKRSKKQRGEGRARG